MIFALLLLQGAFTVFRDGLLSSIRSFAATEILSGIVAWSDRRVGQRQLVPGSSQVFYGEGLWIRSKTCQARSIPNKVRGSLVRARRLPRVENSTRGQLQEPPSYSLWVTRLAGGTGKYVGRPRQSANRSASRRKCGLPWVVLTTGRGKSMISNAQPSRSSWTPITLSTMFLMLEIRRKLVP